MRTTVALILVVGGFLVGLVVLSDGSGDSDWKVEARGLCARSVVWLRRMPPIHLATYGKVVPRMVAADRALARDLRHLDASGDDRKAVAKLAALLERHAGEVDAVVGAYTGKDTGDLDFLAYKRHLRRVHALNLEIVESAEKVGVTACGHPPVRTRYL